MAYLPGDVVGGPTLELRDETDEDVARAALAIDAAIVTFNIADFAGPQLVRSGVGVLTPDDCLIELARQDADGVRAAAFAVIARMRSPPMALPDYVAGMTRAGCPGFAAWLAALLGRPPPQPVRPRSRRGSVTAAMSEARWPLTEPGARSSAARRAKIWARCRSPIE